MYIQNYLLCILYVILIVVQIFTLCHRNYYRGLISLFSFALVAETLWTVMVAVNQTVAPLGGCSNYSKELCFTNIFQYNAQFIHILAINSFILFLLIVAKGWPITRRKMSFKCAFAIFWLFCLTADLITSYWTTISQSLNSAPIFEATNNTQAVINPALVKNSHSVNSTMNSLDSLMTPQPKSDSTPAVPHDSMNNFNSTSHKLSLLIRIVIMIYFLLELRTTMILEQEKKRLQFYLNFGALTMVWLVHTLIVYVISLRVDANWRQELVSGCTAAANFIGFAMTTRLLWPSNPRSHLFRRHGSLQTDTSECDTEMDENDKHLSLQKEEEACRKDKEKDDEESMDFGGDLETGCNDYVGIEMRDLSKPTQLSQQ